LNQLSAIVPIKLGEADKSKSDSGGLMEILFRSLDRFCDPSMFKSVLVVCPSGDVGPLRERVRQWPRLPIEVLDENVVLGGIRIHKATPGWAIQQLVKMAVCRRFETEFFITLDADCFCVRSVGVGDFVQDGKGLIQLEAKQHHIEWWKESGKVLGYRQDFDKPGMCVTPAVLSTVVMSELLDELNRRHGRWDSYLLSYYEPGRFNALRRRLFPSAWTEYSLYFLFLEMQNRLWEFHFETSAPDGREPRTLVSTRSCWTLEDFQKWDPALVFNGKDPAIFTVIQSAIRLNAGEILRKLDGYI